MDRRSRGSLPSRRSSTRSISRHSAGDIVEGPSFELQEERPRAYSVDDGGPTNSVPVAEAESSSWSGIGTPSHRTSIANVMRRSFGRTARSASTAKPRRPSTVESAGPSSARLSTNSAFGLSRVESPYQGATGPSHPYAMFSQDTNVSRAPSNATTPTIRQPERSYSGPRGPTQPYGMYPQNTVTEEDHDNATQNLNIGDLAYPAGARPAPQAHQRRIGPDGEEMEDLIGPYGYAEQLPPYTRYPNDIPPKRDPDASSFVGGPPPDPQPRGVPQIITPQDTTHSTSPQNDAESPSSPHATTAAVMSRPMSLTIDHASPTSPTPTFPPQSNHNVMAPSEPPVMTPRSNPFSDTSTQGSKTAVGSSAASEKSGLRQRAQRLPKKRICWGVLPCWILAGLIAICLAIMIGGIIGGVLAHDQGIKTGADKALARLPSPLPESATYAPTTTVTSIVPAQTPEDAVPVPNPPSSLPALPTGSFSVTLDQPWTTTNSCLTDAAQNNAWDCSTGASLNITIQTQNNAPYIALTYPQTPGKPIQYGAQPPQLSGASSLLYMRDKSRDAFRRGPGYTFQQTYDKAVVVRAEDFPGALPVQRLRARVRRWLGLPDEPDERPDRIFKRHPQSQQSDWSMSKIASVGDRPWLCTWKGTLLSGFIYVTQNVAEQAQYPKSMKLVEKRPAINRIPAVCQQMSIQPDFALWPLTDSEGRPNKVTLNEADVDAAEDDDSAANKVRKRSKKPLRRDMPVGGPRCECAWQST